LRKEASKMKKLLVILVTAMVFGFIGCRPWHGCRMDIGDDLSGMLTNIGISKPGEHKSE
jgi:hypothetical protein